MLASKVIRLLLLLFGLGFRCRVPDVPRHRRLSRRHKTPHAETPLPPSSSLVANVKALSISYDKSFQEMLSKFYYFMILNFSPLGHSPSSTSKPPNTPNPTIMGELAKICQVFSEPAGYRRPFPPPKPKSLNPKP